MFRQIVKSTLFASVISCPGICYSIPAKPGTVKMTQPDGNVVAVTIHGDEYYHYYKTTDGYALQPDSEGWLRYVVEDNGSVRLSDIKANQKERRTVAEKSLLGSIDRGATLKLLDAERMKSVEAKRDATIKRVNSAKPLAVQIDGMLTDYPTVGSPNALVLLVEFPDRKFSTENANAEFTRLMTETGYDYNGATGSALDYFVENSAGLFTPEFKVYGPVTLPKNMSHYGAETANSHDAAPWEMVSDGCSVLKEQNPDLDFSQFDNDGDGVVDNVFVFFAGYGQNSGADPNTIWPHAANISWYGINLVFDGVKVDNYACTNELQGNSGAVRTGIGTFCHEFSHVLGLPDIYSTDYSNAFTPGAYEVMDVGSYNNNGNTPPYMSAYDRMSLRWLNPRELTAPETVTLPDISENKAFLINTAKNEEYYLFENRQKHGWDAYIPGHGMLVWHIDYNASVWSSNTINNAPGHQYIDIVEADGELTEESRAGDTFPGRTGVTEFTDESSPAMSSWTGVRIGKPITDIRELDGVISFKVMGGGDGISPVSAVEATEITPTSFRANWAGDVTIDTYEIDVCAGREVVPFITLTKTTKGSADCYVDVTGLEPSTDYHYVVRAVDGSMKSADSNTIDVKTLEPTFDMLSTIALEATDIVSDGFTASWLPVAGAEHYVLSVYQKRYVTPVYDIVDFTGGIAAMTDGWTTTATSTSGVAGTFGTARPSLALKMNYDRLVSPVYDFDINEISFWYRGNSVADGVLLIEVSSDGEWSVLDEINVTGVTNGTVISYADEIPVGTRAVRFTFLRANGIVYIDDISVAYNGAAEFVYAAGLDNADVGNITSYDVKGLSAATQYFYVVTAHCGDMAAKTSKEITVNTGYSALEEISAETLAVNVLTLNDGIIISGTDGKAAVSVVDATGKIVYRDAAYADGSFIGLSDGFYIVVVGNEAIKVAVK